MDIYSSNWNETDASNSSAAPDGAPEGMAPSGINDVLRAHQGGVKRYVNQNIPKTTAGSSTAFTLSYTVAPGALVDGMTHLVQFNAANGNAPTLNVNALGATPLHYFSAGAWRVVPAALWAADAVFRVAYNSASGAYRILDLPDRTGELVPFAGSTAPAGSLLCYGQAVSRTAYAGLFAALSTAHGTGDGSTTFNLPDLRGRGPWGKDDMGGSAASRVTFAGSAVQATTLGGTGGSQHLAAHNHSLQTRSDINAPGPGATANAPGGGGSDVTGTTGSGGSANMPPVLILNYIIKI